METKRQILEAFREYIFRTQPENSFCPFERIPEGAIDAFLAETGEGRMVDEDEGEEARCFG